MTLAPITRNSLILRLRDREDAASWREFTAIYEPVIYKVACRRGLQHADALELVQRVLFAVARSVDRFRPDKNRAKFRTWLYTISHNEFCKQLAKSQKQVSGSGDSAVHQMLHEFAAPVEDDFSAEYRRAVFRWAAEKVRNDFEERTWSAFWKTSVENQGAADVGRELKMSVGAVYIAKSRVMKALREQATEYEQQPDGDRSWEDPS